MTEEQKPETTPQTAPITAPPVAELVVVETPAPKPSVDAPPKNAGPKMARLGIEVLKDLDLEIAKGSGPDKLRNWMLKHYRGQEPIPGKNTLAKYIKERKEFLFKKVDAVARMKKETEYTEQQLREMLARLNMANLEIGDRKILLEKIIGFLLMRIQAFVQVQEVLMDAKYEQIMINQLTLIHTVTETLLRLEGQIGFQEFVAQRIVEKFLEEIVPACQRSVEKVFGDSKVKEFLLEFEKQQKTVNFDRLRQEATVEASAFEKGGEASGG